jgi:hypothetical protein
MRILIVACFASLVMGSALAAELGEMPATAKTAEQIVSAAEGVKGFGFVETAEFNHLGRRIFALWFCPFSGRAACYLRVYYYDREKVEWRRFINELINGTHDLSAELPCPIPHVAANPPGSPPGQRLVDGMEEMIVFRSVRGEIVFKASVADLPRQPHP